MSEPERLPDEATAREHLVTVQSILERTGRISRPTPYTYLIWALTSATYYIGYWHAARAYQSTLFLAANLLLILAYVMTIVEFIGSLRAHTTSTERQALFAFACITTFLWVLKFVWYDNNLIDGRAYALLWSSGFAVSLGVLGVGPMRPLRYGGMVVALSMLVGGRVPNDLSLVLALGNLLGVGGPGIYFLVQRHRNG